LQGLILVQESIGREQRPLSWVINDQKIYRKEVDPVQKELRRAERIAATQLRSPDEL
jgi:NADH-quinone oxidoreductase subunit B